MKAATAVVFTNGRAHQEWQKKIKNMQACTRLWCYITANFYQAETSVQVGQSLLSFEFYIKAGARRDYKRGRYWNNSFGKKKTIKKKKQPSNQSASCFDFFYSCVSTEVEVFSELWHPSFRKRLPGLYKWLQSCENNDNCCAPQPTQWP